MNEHLATLDPRAIAAALEAAANGIVITSADGVIQWANPAFSRMTGYPLEEVIGRNPRIFKSGRQDPAVYVDLWRTILAGKPWRGRLVNKRKDGTFYTEELTITPVLGAAGEISHFIAIKQDVTEREEAEKRLRESEQLHRALIETTPDAISMTDLKGDFQMISPNAARLFGAADAAAGLGTNVMDWIAPEDRPRAAAAMEQLLRLEPSEPLEFRLLKTCGATFAGEIHSAALTNPDGSPRAMISIIRDVTARKSLEEQLREAQKMEAVGLLAGGVAHDFNNMLAVIMGQGELLLSEMPDDDSRRYRVREILNAAGRTADLTRQLLAFGRRQVLRPRVVDLNLCVAGIRRMIEPLLGERIRFVTDLAEVPATVKVDPGQLEQIVINLAINGRDAMPEGGALTIRTRHRTCGEPGQPRAEHVVLEVSDTGHGMDEATQSRIFEPFFTTKTLGKGSGLGLSTVYGIVQQSGGAIRVWSEPGQGASFQLSFPACDGDVEPEDRPRVAEALPARETILVVEDEAGVRNLIATTLSAQGYQVLLAEDGEEGLRVCRENTHDLDALVADIVMPRMGGQEMVRIALSENPSLKVLFVSGHSADAALAGGSLGPGRAFLQKPFSSGSLCQKVREVLES